MKPERYEPWIYPVFRMVVGFLFVCHGLQKFGLLGGHAVPILSLLGAARLIETVCGTLVGIGLFTRPAAFIAAGEMAAAYFIRHQPGGWLPILNHGEDAVFYCFTFLYIAAHGAGRFAIDGLRSRRR